MNEDPNVVHEKQETVGSVLSDAVETLYRARMANLPQEDPVASEKLCHAYRERDRFKIRFLKALLRGR